MKKFWEQYKEIIHRCAKRTDTSCWVLCISFFMHCMVVFTWSVLMFSEDSLYIKVCSVFVILLSLFNGFNSAYLILIKSDLNEEQGKHWWN